MSKSFNKKVLYVLIIAVITVIIGIITPKIYDLYKNNKKKNGEDSIKIIQESIPAAVSFSDTLIIKDISEDIPAPPINLIRSQNSKTLSLQELKLLFKEAQDIVEEIQKNELLEAYGGVVYNEQNLKKLKPILSVLHENAKKTNHTTILEWVEIINEAYYEK